jgi:DNA (cytosine-5)-methyltransferase 1
VRILDLFCGAGGAGTGYHRAGFDVVVGVDIAPQPNYPFVFHQGDALEFLAAHGDSFDAVHASPPCQTHSALTKGNRARGWTDEHRDWIADTRALLDELGLPYVIENVQGAPLRRDLTLCGLMFGLRVFRHRYFELGGWTMPEPAHPSHKGHRVAGWRHGVKHDGDMVAVYGDGGGKGSVADWQAAMGMDWTGVKLELAEAIPPAYTEFIGAALADTLTLEVAA